MFLHTIIAVAPVQAFELFGVCLIGQCESEASDAENFIDPHRYRLDFEVNDASEKLIDTIKGASQLWVGKDNAVAGAAGVVARSKGDYRRILVALYNSGYYGGSISVKINGREAADIPASTSLPFESSIVVRVDPGDAYRFGRADIRNTAPPTSSPDDRVKDIDRTLFLPGEIAKAGEIRSAGNLEVEAWRQQGYPTAKVAKREATADHPDRKLNVLLHMQPGKYAAYGEFRVRGTERMDPDFVAYMAGIEPGKEFDPDDLKKAQKRLDRLGVFSSSRIVEADKVVNGLLPMELIVNERKRRRIGLGATLSSVDGIGLEAYWLHRNLFGKAESIRLDAKVGGLGSTLRPDEFDYFLGGTFVKPGAFSPDTDLTADLFAKREFNETFEETSAGGSFFLTNYYSDRLTLTGGGFFSYGEFEDGFGTRQFLTTGLRGGAIYDGRDSKLEPTEGIYAELDARPFYEWQFGNAAARLEAEARTYFDFDTDGYSVVAGRIKLGSLLGSSLSQTPPNLLFTTGGGNSVRGYSFKSIGVTGPAGKTVGGASLLEGSIEFRQKVTESFGIVGFVDAGTVGRESFVDFSQDLRIGAGLGIRYYTGLGPVRLDVAVPLNRGPDDAGFAIYAGIGQAF